MRKSSIESAAKICGTNSSMLAFLRVVSPESAFTLLLIKWLWSGFFGRVRHAQCTVGKCLNFLRCNNWTVTRKPAWKICSHTASTKMNWHFEMKPSLWVVFLISINGGVYQDRGLERPGWSLISGLASLLDASWREVSWNPWVLLGEVSATELMRPLVAKTANGPLSHSSKRHKQTVRCHW